MNFLRIVSTKNYFILIGTVKQLKVTRKSLLEPLCTYPFNQHERYSIKVVQTEKKSLIVRIKNAIGYKDLYTKRLLARSALLYEKTVDSIDYPLFFKEFELPDTFVSWFVVTELHVWMLAVRLMADINNGKEMRDTLIEMMWRDYEQRVKKLGPMSGKIRRKNTLLLAEQMNAVYVAYDEGLSTDDRILADAIWKRFFDSKCNNPEHLEKLVCYVRKEVARFDNMPLAELLFSENVKWTNVKSCTHLAK